MENQLESHRKHPVWPFIATLTGMIVVFGSFLLLLLLCGDGGSGNGSGGGIGNGIGRGIGNGIGRGIGNGIGRGSGTGNASGNREGHGTGNQAGSSDRKNSGVPGTATAAQGSGKASGNDRAGSGSPTPKPAQKPSPVPAAPQQQAVVTPVAELRLRQLIPFQIPDQKHAPPSGSDTANSGPAAWGTGSGSGGSASGGGTFYGIRNRGNTLYIVDVSGSMSSSTAEGPSRIDILKKQLINAVRGEYRKESMAKYSVIAFSSAFTTFPENRQQARYLLLGDLKKLEHFANALTSGNGTGMMTAWQEACRQLKTCQVDTIYFLTDGEPTDCNMPDLIRYIQQNVPAKTLIHTIIIGAESKELEALAKKYHGRCRSIR